MDQRQTQTRLAHGLRLDRCGCRDRVDTSLTDHAVQGANAAHDGDLISDASLVAPRDRPGFTGDSHAHDRIVVRRSLVESSVDGAAASAHTRCDMAGATEPFRVDVQSAAE